jgi:hypothetical protein
MSNRLCIVSTEFRNARTEGTTYGVRIYDNYDNVYDNLWEGILYDDLEILATVLKDTKGNERVEAMFDFIQENENGIDIDGEWYDWDQIKHLFK